MSRPAKMPPAPEAEARKVTLVIDGWTPPSANELWKAPHWSVGHKLKMRAWQEVAVAARFARPAVKAAKGRRRVSLVVTTSGRGRLPDPDNLWKVILDALKVNRLIVDDSAHYCELGKVTVERGKARKTVIELEDLE